MTAADKMNRKHVNSSIMQGYCPSCGNRSLTYPKNPEYGGLACRHEGCNWKNVYYIGKPTNKSKMAGSSDSSKSKSDSGILIDMTNKNKRYRTGICYTCKDHPNGKVIDPTTDKYARQMETGEWICGVCAGENTKKVLSLFGGQKQRRRENITMWLIQWMVLLMNDGMIFYLIHLIEARE
jgi:hypothetical protein